MDLIKMLGVLSENMTLEELLKARNTAHQHRTFLVNQYTGTDRDGQIRNWDGYIAFMENELAVRSGFQPTEEMLTNLVNQIIQG